MSNNLPVLLQDPSQGNFPATVDTELEFLSQARKLLDAGFPDHINGDRLLFTSLVLIDLEVKPVAEWRADRVACYNPSNNNRGDAMPVVSVFFGIVVRMWHDDHPPPHIHAEYQGFEALVRIEDGEVAEGRLPRVNGDRLLFQVLI
ncbi:MAG: DUF4160 domain-containing protein [Campylobacterales bacterium]